VGFSFIQDNLIEMVLNSLMTDVSQEVLCY